MAATRDALDSLPPWEAIPYFELPRETAVALTANVSKQIVGANPQRVALIMAAQGVSAVIVSTKNPASAASGIQLLGSLPPVQLLFQETGPLCQQAWFGFTTFDQSVTVYEVVLSKWPRANVPRNGARRGT